MDMYGYEYFCGANIVLELEGMPVLEAVGLSFNISESKRPIYGYSSRHFDAVASGQVLLTGSLLVNYIDQNYLFYVIEHGLQGDNIKLQPNVELKDTILNEDQVADLVTNYSASTVDTAGLINSAKRTYWGNDIIPTTSPSARLPNPHDAYFGLNLRITAGDRGFDDLGFSTGFMIRNLHFNGRGMRINIDEEGLVEEHSFIARHLTDLPRSNILAKKEVKTTDVTTGIDLIEDEVLTIPPPKTNTQAFMPSWAGPSKLGTSFSP